MKRSRRSLEAARLSLTFLCQSPIHDSCLIISKLLGVTCPDGASSIEVVELVEQRNWIPETKCSLVQSMLDCQCHEISLTEFSPFRQPLVVQDGPLPLLDLGLPVHML